MDADLRRQFKAFADGLQGPLGPIPFDRVLHEHIGLFENLRNTGCTWPQLARALAAAGARRADGKLYSPDHLRGAVSRQIKAKADVWASKDLMVSGPPRHPRPAEAKGANRSNVDAEQTNVVPATLKNVPMHTVGGNSPAPFDKSRSVQDKLARVAKLRDA